jgi:hypothetical protein
MTETARMADLVLPATMFLEHDDLYTGGGQQHIPREAPLHQLLLGGDRDRVGVLDQHRGHRRAVAQGTSSS